MIKEEAPTNSTGSGQVAGLGQGSQGEPPGKMKSKVLKRFKKFMEKTDVK